MNDDFATAMRRALGKTRANDPLRATAIIQEALSRQTGHAPGAPDPVDPVADDATSADAADDSTSAADPSSSEGSVRLVKGGVSRGRRSPSRRAVVAGGAGLALLVAGGVAVGVWQLRGDGGNEVADLAASDSADVAAIGTEVDRGWRELESVRVRIDLSLIHI